MTKRDPSQLDFWKEQLFPSARRPTGSTSTDSAPA